MSLLKRCDFLKSRVSKDLCIFLSLLLAFTAWKSRHPKSSTSHQTIFAEKEDLVTHFLSYRLASLLFLFKLGITETLRVNRCAAMATRWLSHYFEYLSFFLFTRTLRAGQKKRGVNRRQLLAGKTGGEEKHNAGDVAFYIRENWCVSTSRRLDDGFELCKVSMKLGGRRRRSIHKRLNIYLFVVVRGKVEGGKERYKS